MDIWQYIYLEKMELFLYFARYITNFDRDGLILLIDDRFLSKNEAPKERSIRFRTLGCYPLTGATESEASNLTEVIQEATVGYHIRKTRALIDKDSGASMEIKKQQGYF